MSDNSTWWLLLPCGIVAIAITTVIVVTVRVLRPGPPAVPGRPGVSPSSRGYSGSPLDATWTPDAANLAAPPPDPGHSPHGSHDHWQSHGHTIHHHHHDPGPSPSDSGPGWSDSGSSSSDSGPSHHHSSD